MLPYLLIHLIEVDYGQGNMLRPRTRLFTYGLIFLWFTFEKDSQFRWGWFVQCLYIQVCFESHCEASHKPKTSKVKEKKKVFMKEFTHLLLNVEHHVTTRQSSGKRLTLIENVAIVQVSYKLKIWFNMNDVGICDML